MTYPEVQPAALGVVSVVIPNYNCAPWLPSVISSCLAQGPLLKEIIVVDDFSTDNSLDILNQLSISAAGKLKVLNSRRKGANSARNFGFLHASGKYIQWLDADDVLLPGKFASQVACLETDASADVVYSDWYEDCYNKGLELVARKQHIMESYDDFLFQILADNWSVPASYLFRRNIAERLSEIGAWNPKRPVAQDREYVTLAALNGARFAYVPGFFAAYNRWNETSTSNMKFEQRLAHQLVLESYFRDIIAAAKFSRSQKARYFALLNAHALNACFYNRELKLLHPFWPQQVNFRLIHWKKWPFIPGIYLTRMLKFFLRRNKTRPVI